MRSLRAAFVLLFLLVNSLSALEIYLNRAFTTGEKPVATLYASGEGTLYLRVYRIDDVDAYLRGQANAHTVTEKNERLMQPGYFLWTKYPFCFTLSSVVPNSLPFNIPVNT